MHRVASFLACKCTSVDWLTVIQNRHRVVSFREISGITIGTIQNKHNNNSLSSYCTPQSWWFPGCDEQFYICHLPLTAPIVLIENWNFTAELHSKSVKYKLSQQYRKNTCHSCKRAYKVQSVNRISSLCNDKANPAKGMILAAFLHPSTRLRRSLIMAIITISNNCDSEAHMSLESHVLILSTKCRTQIDLILV